MPWDVSERNIGRRPSLQAMSGGGYSMYQKPNPNDLVENYKRGMTTGDHRESVNMAQLQEDARRGDQEEAAKDAAYEQQMHDEGRIDTIGHASMGSMNRGQNAQSSWAPFLQALKNQRVTGLATGAANRGFKNGVGEVGPGAGASPGFYDNPTPSMVGLQQAAETGYGANTWDRKQDQIRRRI